MVIIKSIAEIEELIEGAACGYWIPGTWLNQYDLDAGFTWFNY